MSTLALFFCGLFVTLVFTGGVFLISLSEAADPDTASDESLSDFEQKLVGEKRKAAKKADDGQ